MDAMGKYIYGVIEGGDGERFPLDGVVRFGADAAQSAASCGQAYTVTWQDISAVVSDAPILDYRAMPKDALARLLVRHQQIIEQVMAGYTVLPLRLGTCAESEEQVRDILARGYETIKDVLHRARGVVEIDVTATIGDFASFLRRVSQAREINELKQAVLRASDAVTREDQMKVGMLVGQHADKEKQRMFQRIHAGLNPLAEDFRAHDLMDEKMVLNSAFLIRRDRLGDFDNQLEQLNGQFDNALDFRCVGPLPPYSFYTLEVRVTNFEEMDWARRQLGLSDDLITTEAIKKAHRRLALTCHPDKNRNVPDIEKKFADMSRAYKTLLDYYRASGGAEHEEGFYLDRQAVERNSILVTTLG